MSRREHQAQPEPRLRLIDSMAIIVGIVVGAGIFRAPSLVAQFSGSTAWMLLAWVAGGLICVLGALCYAELAATWPHAGGDYHFLHRAYGRQVSFLFAWARCTVITTGSLALLAFVLGDYLQTVLPLGPYGAGLWAALAITGLTALNLRGLSASSSLQNWLTLAQVLGLFMVVAAGVWLWWSPAHQMPEPSGLAGTNSLALPSLFGLAMVFVLLTYGGWNEAAYLSAEMHGSRRSTLYALLLSLAVICGLYLLVNLAYVYGLGLEGMAQSEAVAADLLALVLGRQGQMLVACLVALAALTSMNATMLVGARSQFALGRDWPMLQLLGRWDAERAVPRVALLTQSVLALLLVALGALLRSGFEAMVDYTAPVFWSFFLLCALALIVLRRREPLVVRPFQVPGYPWVPLLFAAVCTYMLWSSLVHVRTGALFGVGMLALGGLVLAWLEWQARRTSRTVEGEPASSRAR